MPLGRSLSVGVVGIAGHLVEVEADLATGLPGMALIGLPDTALSEARDRIRAAVVNSGETWPSRRITVGLSPAALPKRGSGFDLAIAVAVMAAAGAIPAPALDGVVLLGELGLDGRARPVPGILPAVLAASAAGRSRVVVPAENCAEASLVPGVTVLPVRSLAALLAVLRGDPPPAEPAEEPVDKIDTGRPERAALAPVDLADVVGQPVARWALEVAAAGGHHLYLSGPPGTGKTMLAERLPGLLPPLDRAAALEVTAVHSVAGVLRPGTPLVTRPPFAAPHHTATVAAIVGGGSGLARPGAASLAHRGVLFLDEAPEFRAGCLDALRQPLENGEVVLARSGGSVRYPARFLLVLAANPCPCAAATGSACTCAPFVRRRYAARLSGPLLDRIDLAIEVQPVSRVDLLADRTGVEPTATVAERVAAARARAAAALAGTPWRLAVDIPSRELRRRFAPAPGAVAPLERSLRRGLLTARGVDRALRVAWTLAFLDGRDRPGSADVARAIGLRTGAAA